MPDGTAIKGRSTPASLPARFPVPGKCTSHLGFGLVLLVTATTPFAGGTRIDEEHPFSMKSKLPTTDETDETALMGIALPFFETSIRNSTQMRQGNGHSWT